MTSQDEDRKQLNDKAKKLGIKCPHTCGLDTLLKKIADAEALAESTETMETATEPVKVEPVRSTAPSMKVENILVDDRTLLMQRLEAEDPECKYIFQSGSITDRELKEKGLERTDNTLRGDVLCRTQKDSYYAVKAARQKADHEAMERIDGGKGIVGSFQQDPKQPRS